jgi:hypothetical protein
MTLRNLASVLINKVTTTEPCNQRQSENSFGTLVKPNFDIDDVVSVVVVQGSCETGFITSLGMRTWNTGGALNLKAK